MEVVIFMVILVLLGFVIGWTQGYKYGVYKVFKDLKDDGAEIHTRPVESVRYVIKK
jgi:hypothetical protein